MTIVLTYTKEDGSQKQVEFGEDSFEIDLRGLKITSIDLMPLSTCTNLQQVKIGDNLLDTVDLSFVESCRKLESLWMNDNKLREINLSPLRSCPDLGKLSLANNLLESVDLTPLGACKNFRILFLNNNRLTDIDLTSLEACTELRWLVLNNNQQLQNIDLSPLIMCRDLKTLELSSNRLRAVNLVPLSYCTDLHLVSLDYTHISALDITPIIRSERLSLKEVSHLYSWLPQKDSRYRRPEEKYSWSFLYQVADENGKDRRVQYDILHALGLNDYGFVDTDLRDIFLEVPPETPPGEVQSKLIPTLIDEVIAAVDCSDTTIGLNLEKVVTKHSEIARIAKKIIKLRKDEMKETQIGLTRGEVDLRGLWTTAYGYEILMALDEGLTTKPQRYQEIDSALIKLRLYPKTGAKFISPDTMSNELKESIWWFAEYRKGASWEEIAKKIIRTIIRRILKKQGNFYMSIEEFVNMITEEKAAIDSELARNAIQLLLKERVLVTAGYDEEYGEEITIKKKL